MKCPKVSNKVTQPKVKIFFFQIEQMQNSWRFEQTQMEGRCYIQQNDTQHNAIQHKNIQHYDIEHNESIKGLFVTLSINDTQYIRHSA
jgi:hypothetical protein